jgi:uncharacterized protein DUF1440
MIGERGDLRWWETSGAAEPARGPLPEEATTPLRGLCAGLAAGLFATLAMDGFQSFLESAGKAIGEGDQTARSSGGEESSTVELGRRISRRVMHRDLDDDSAELASEGLHYGYGTLMGGVYGLLGALFPRVTTANGAPWGALLFLLGDEVMVPALGLAKPPTEYPVATHARALGAHLVYGTTLDLLRRGILECMAERDQRREGRLGTAGSSLLWIDSTELESGAI